MKLLNHIPAWLKNKYFLSASAFIVWLLFFDPRDVFTQMEHRRQLVRWRAERRGEAGGCR